MSEGPVWPLPGNAYEHAILTRRRYADDYPSRTLSKIGDKPMSTDLKSTEIMQGYDSARRFAAQFRDLFKFVDVLGELGNIMALTEKAQARLDALKKEHTKEIADVNAQKASAKAEADRMLAEAEAHNIRAQESADNLMANAHNAHSKVVAEANDQKTAAMRQAEQIVREAHEHAAKHEADTRSRMSGMMAAVDSLEQEHERLTNAIAAKNTEHQKITSMIADIKAKLG